MKKHFNYPLLFLIIILVGFSFLFLSCLSSADSLKRFGTTNYYLIHQILSGLLPGLILAFIAYKTPLTLVKKIAPLLVILNIIALFSVFLPGIGIKAGGASRWVGVGFFTFQPSEFLKITAILYLSAWIASKLSETNTSDWKSITKNGYHNIIYILAPFIVFIGLIALGLNLQRDITTLGIITATLFVIYFTAKTPFWHTLFLVIAGTGFFFLFWIRFEPYRLNRLITFLNPNDDPLGKGLQLKQSLLALGSGGLFGKGLGMSAGKFFLPQSTTDSIFAIIGEELGIVGCVALIACFIFLFWLGVKIAKNSNDKFSKMVAVGIVFWITFQAFVNIASTAGVFPLAGIPLPFFSTGGSHLVVELIAVGLLLNISKNTT